MNNDEDMNRLVWCFHCGLVMRRKEFGRHLVVKRYRKQGVSDICDGGHFDIREYNGEGILEDGKIDLEIV